ncbi:cytochrome P450 [Streptomyces sp. RFCAC02]|uniref:cytochrome P450 family protein n=1 Tax=Streptomyces sp. RFCAC02 TaxID=2499143 RepID=UPI00101F8990|nr:cytochrome P450 [Streptomyces sp. RFCAC02]
MTTQPLVEIDPTGSDLYGEADRLRAAGSAVKVALPDGVTAWSVTRGDIARHLLLHPAVSKDARKNWPGYRPGAIPWLTAWVDVKSMFTSDGDEHRRLRRLIGGAFTPARIEALRPALERIVADLIDDLRQVPAGGTVDLRPAFSYKVPTRLITDLFGVPEEQRARMLAAMDAVLTTAVSVEQMAATQREMYEVMGLLLATKRENPGEDLTSHMLTVREADGDQLSEEELVSTLILMIGAGSETAVSMIDHAVHAMLTHPEQRAAVLRQPERWADVIEETLRVHPPIMHLPMRYAADDIALPDGVTIPKGDLILIGFGAHGRDPGVHADPDTFDIDRADKQHLVFGHGIHFCLGAPLARLEGMVALPALFAAFPEIRAAGDGRPAMAESFIAGDLRSLPVVLTDAPAATA